MKAEPEHTHNFKLISKLVRVHNYRHEDGELKAVDMTARDTLKQRICTGCPLIETYDLERKTFR